MQGIILAGGFGTRLKSVITDIPKPMAPINGKPFLEYLLKYYSNIGFTKIVLAVGYKADIIVNYFGNHFEKIELLYSYENQPLGTGGAIKKALKLLSDEYVYIFNGDTFVQFEINEIFKPKNILILNKFLKKTDRYGIMNIKNQVVEQFIEKKLNNTGYINAGVYLIRKNIFDNYDLGEFFSIEKDFFEKYTKDLSIDTISTEGYFIDIGIPEDYEKAGKDFNEKSYFFR